MFVGLSFEGCGIRYKKKYIKIKIKIYKDIYKIYKYSKGAA